MDKTNYRQTEYNKPFIIQRADPYVYRHSDGTYWFTASVPEYDRIVLRKSNTVDGLAQAEEVTIWRKHENGIMSVHIWAPEIHYVDNKWFIYFAGGDIEDIWAIRPYVLMCEGDDPLKDPWKEMGMLKRKDAFSFQDFSLDMTVFENMGQWYCVWAEKVSVGKKISNLYIARMDSPTSLATEQVLLTSPGPPAFPCQLHTPVNSRRLLLSGRRQEQPISISFVSVVYVSERGAESLIDQYIRQYGKRL